MQAAALTTTQSLKHLALCLLTTRKCYHIKCGEINSFIVEGRAY